MLREALILDTETTDIEDPEVIQLAWIKVDQVLNELERFNKLYKPDGQISFGAMATHHIMPEHLKGGLPSELAAVPEGTVYIIGHNIDFDWRALGCPAVKRICTLALCRYLWPTADSHTLAAMLYMLTGSEHRDKIMGAHDASVDVWLNWVLLWYIMNELAQQGHQDAALDFEKLWEVSETARVPTVMPFGKHKGDLISSVPADYKQWLLRQDDVDPYLVKALRA